MKKSEIPIAPFQHEAIGCSYVLRNKFSKIILAVISSYLCRDHRLYHVSDLCHQNIARFSSMHFVQSHDPAYVLQDHHR